MLSHKTYHIIKDVLDAERLRYAPIRTSTAPVGGPSDNANDVSLFEYMTRHNCPEIRAQEAFFPHLLAAGLTVHREMSADVGGKRRVFDFVVSDDSGEVIVELKHYSPHQTGQFGALLGPVINGAGEALQSLYQDYRKPRPPDIPLIVVGLYTAVEGWHGQAGQKVPREQRGSYFVERFARRPADRASCADQARKTLGNWQHRSLFTCPVQTATANDFCEGPDSIYVSSTGVTVKGRVNYFMGLATAPRAQERPD